MTEPAIETLEHQHIYNLGRQFGPEEISQANWRTQRYSNVGPAQYVGGEEGRYSDKNPTRRKFETNTLAPTPHQTEMFANQGAELPYHAMSPRQFAASPNVWWHGRYGESMPHESYVEDPNADYMYDEEDEGPPEDEDKTGYTGIHFGTRAAAISRLHTLGPGRTQDEESYGDEEDVPMGNEFRKPGRFFPVTLNHEQFKPRITEDVGHDWRPQMGYETPAHKGLYYQNAVEDPGSISAVVPQKDLPVRSMGSHSDEFFQTWNDHVLNQYNEDPESVHPALVHAARYAPEHTGEDWIHPDDLRHMARAVQNSQEPQLFRPYSGGERAPLHIPGVHDHTEDLQHPIYTKPAIYLGNEIAGTQKLQTIKVGK